MLDGGEEEIRTPDPHVANVMLYQLSYFPKFTETALIISYSAISHKGEFCVFCAEGKGRGHAPEPPKNHRPG